MFGWYDIVYTLAAVLSAPLWLIKSKTRHKVAAALRNRMGDVPTRAELTPAIMIHAVSLGEVNATRSLVDKLRAVRPELSFIISTTTNTGYDRAQILYGSAARTTIIRYPLDLTAAVTRVLDRLRPSAVVLMELEVWPNFLKQCTLRNIPVLVVNARLTTSSFRNYRRGGFLVRRMFRRIARVCAQDETYAQRFRQLGVPPQRVLVTGTMKFDNAAVAERIAGADDLAHAVSLRSDQKVWVCGSTGPGEEEIILHVYRTLLTRFPNLRLVIVPRHPERFDAVAKLIQDDGINVIRRSNPPAAADIEQLQNLQPPPVVLGDTMGELRAFYSLADIVFVGRTLVDLGPRQHGSDMIEPAALAKPVIVGPHTGNFAEAMAKFREAAAIRIVQSATDLEQVATNLLAHPEEAAHMGQRAAQVVRENQGATDRHVAIILEALDTTTQHLATTSSKSQ
jgi:3-deoxy-D-manno-octulosonic-acid transferase